MSAQKIVPEAKFTKNGFFPESRQEAVLLRCRTELDEFIEELLTEVRCRDSVAEPFFPEYEKVLRDFYAEYDETFFVSRDLVIALLERGSGSLSFKLDAVTEKDGVLCVTVSRHSPMMQTMDYRTHLMLLSVPKTEATKVEVSIIKQ